MSPEQAQGKPADARSDIFSFGLVLYELLSGRRAFAGNSEVETMPAIIRDEPAQLDAPPKLSRIVMRCLLKLPAKGQTSSRLGGTWRGCNHSPLSGISVTSPGSYRAVNRWPRPLPAFHDGVGEGPHSISLPCAQAPTHLPAG